MNFSWVSGVVWRMTIVPTHEEQEHRKCNIWSHPAFESFDLTPGIFLTFEGLWFAPSLALANMAVPQFILRAVSSSLWLVNRSLTPFKAWAVGNMGMTHARKLLSRLHHKLILKAPEAAGGLAKDPGIWAQGLKRRPACCERTSAINTFSVSYHIRLFTCWRLLITLAAPPRRKQFNFKAQYFKSYRADMTPLKPAHQPADISSAGLKVAAGQISTF